MLYEPCRWDGCTWAAEKGEEFCVEHALLRIPAEHMRQSGIIGKVEPRIYTPPLQQLTPDTSLGFELIQFSSDIGVELMPHQKWLAIHGLELRVERLRFRTVLVLIARQNGKTTFKRVITLWRMFRRAARLVVGTSQDLAQAREVLRDTVAAIRETPQLAEKFIGEWKERGNEHFLLDNGARYLIRAMNRGAGRGLSVDELNIDELREQRDWGGWAALSKTTNAVENAQAWLMSNAGDVESIVLNHLRQVALAGSDPQMFLAEWSGPEGCALDDREAWAQANPALGHKLDEETLHSDMIKDTPAVFRTEVLCQNVDQLNTAVDLEAWAADADPQGTMDDVRDKVCVCVGVAPDGVHVTAAAAAELDDGRLRIEVVASWASTTEARAGLADTVELVEPARLGWYDVGPGKLISSTMRKLGAEDIKGASVSEAHMTFADRVKARRILHSDDPLLNAHLSRVGRTGPPTKWEFAQGVEPIDAAWAAAGAVHLALNAPPPPKPTRRVVIVPQ